jgi:hypothetical protein
LASSLDELQRYDIFLHGCIGPLHHRLSYSALANVPVDLCPAGSGYYGAYGVSGTRPMGDLAAAASGGGSN